MNDIILATLLLTFEFLAFGLVASWLLNLHKKPHNLRQRQNSDTHSGIR